MTVCLVGCDVQVKAIMVGLSRLSSLRLDNCRQISREFVHRLSKDLPFSMPSKSFFGFAAVPDASERIAFTDLRRKQVCGVSLVLLLSVA